ncbi:hypothetical protein L484_011573 [Morus notabilis]|uniref:Pentacotripeptide-repeat region of PRORP domain-containing protein n=1 Tax=Morus notabilis TaxID=981085 RepID=W9RAJ3_9ROSA|nr:pentatricopeptide repeat-containing protein At2g20710, mitochondrial [Morus notabilis]EXB79633.1 hypothetical protein L484_011573 [Morus notabilis]
MAVKLHCSTKLAAFGFLKNLQKCSLLSISLLSTRTLSSSSSNSSSNSSDSLFQRIQVIRDPKASVLPVLRQWVDEGRPIGKTELGWLVRTMKDFRRFNHALEISLWMTDSRFLRISPSDAAIRLDLIYRVHGLERAENYFNSVSRKLRTRSAYVALLRSYVRENSVEKAKASMQEMRNMGMINSSLPYNILINLYTQNGQFDKIDMLMQEMETKGIPHDKYTLRNRMSAYIAASDILGMQNILNRMEEDPCFSVDWKVYSLAASGYQKVGMLEEALETLRKLEQEIAKTSNKTNKSAFMFLLTLYSSIGNRDELYRVWSTYKPSNGLIDLPYACMIRSLTKLDDIEGAERIYDEWESKSTFYDFRVLNSILAAYCKEGLFEKAESALEKAVKGRTTNTASFNILANGYAKNNKMPKAVEMLKKGLSIGRKGWMPSCVTLAACLDYLKEQGDVTGMKEIISALRNADVLSMDTCQELLRACDAAGESFLNRNYTQKNQNCFKLFYMNLNLLATNPV